ncbi:MAG: DUF4333 domain-containing protein [Actinobacteria bacterium]|jgi:hypothetical protein|nr:DUF4333 domain-containing protein [Actinomycetota bacterium]
MTFVKSALIGTVLVAATLLAGCSSVSTLDTAKLQDGIVTGLADQLGGEWTVTCPADQKIGKGLTFNCEAVSKADGTTGTIVVTQTDDEGNVTWETTDQAG